MNTCLRNFTFFPAWWVVLCKSPKFVSNHNGRRLLHWSPVWNSSYPSSTSKAIAHIIFSFNWHEKKTFIFCVNVRFYAPLLFILNDAFFVKAIPFLVGCPACLRNFLNLFCELSCSPNQSLFINVTSVSEVCDIRVWQLSKYLLLLFLFNRKRKFFCDSTFRLMETQLLMLSTTLWRKILENSYLVLARRLSLEPWIHVQ